MSIENSDGLLEEIGAQALTTASYQLPDSVLQTIDAVAHDDVVQVYAVLMINELPIGEICISVEKNGDLY